jgi:hypothetical protein
MNTNIPDELLSAYVDGELDGTQRARIEQAIALDARLAQRVARQRALRAPLRPPLPQRLVNAARLSAPSGPAQIIDLARVRAARARRPEKLRARLPRRTAIALAGCLLVGLGAGLLIESLITGTGPTKYRNGSLLASGSLDSALDDALAGAPAGSGAVRIGLTFRARTGSLCRTFAIETGHALAGLACRQQQHWRILTVIAADTASVPGSTPARRTAVPTLPAPLSQAVEQQISGEPLDAAAEARARRGGWH